MTDIEFFCQLGKIIVCTILKIDGRIIRFIGIAIFIIISIRIFWEQPVFIYCTICSIIWIFTLGNWTTKSFWFKTYILCVSIMNFSMAILLYLLPENEKVKTNIPAAAAGSHSNTICKICHGPSSPNSSKMSS